MRYLHRFVQFDETQFAVDVENAIDERTNLRQLIYAMKDAPLVRADGDRLILEERQWGWLPSNWKPSENYKTSRKYQRERANARSEGIHSTYGFRFEFAAGNC